VDLLLRKLEISKALWDDGCLPEEWWSLGEYDFQNMVRNLDRAGSGSVNWKQLATFIILSLRTYKAPLISVYLTKTMLPLHVITNRVPFSASIWAG
jgi:hypothetical protein